MFNLFIYYPLWQGISSILIALCGRTTILPLAYWCNFVVSWKITLMMMQLACSDINATRCNCGSAPFSEAYRRMCSWSGFVYSYFAFPHFSHYYLHFQGYFFFFNCLISPLWNTISPTKFSSRTYFVFCNGACFCFNTLVISRLWIIFFQYSINLLCFMSAKLWFCWYYSLDHFFVFCFFPPLHTVDLTPRDIFLRNLL